MSMDPGSSRQNEPIDLSKAHARAGRIVAAAKDELDSGDYSGFDEHVREYNALIRSIWAWEKYIDFYAIPDHAIHENIAPDAKAKFERSKLVEVLSKAARLQEALGQSFREIFICSNGDVQDGPDPHAGQMVHCTVCGELCIFECPHCNSPIRGPQIRNNISTYQRPQFCHACGRPYPWMQKRLDTALDLLRHDDHLSLEDRESLWGDLRFVMSNPKADLVPAKTKLVEIKLKNASLLVKETVMELVAKTTAEFLKG